MEEVGRTLLGIGLRPEQLNIGQAALRAVIVYVVALAIVRFGKKRFMARASPFDVIVGIVIGSTAARGITGNAPLSTAFGGVAVVVAYTGCFPRWRCAGAHSER